LKNRKIVNVFENWMCGFVFDGLRVCDYQNRIQRVILPQEQSVGGPGSSGEQFRNICGLILS
jgi:hypothetical protein